MKRKEVAIVGAGVSGLAAAWSLRDTEASVTVFEKSRGVSGRAASRTRDGVRYDHGACFFKTPGRSVAALIHEHLASPDLVRIENDVWTFDASGRLSPGDPALNAEPKWTYTSGISTLGKLLLATSSARLESRVRVRRLDREDQTWRLTDWDGNDLGCFDAVLLTPPAPQSAEILQESRLPSALQIRLADSLSRGTYHCQFSVVLGIGGEIARPGGFHALLNADRGHDLAWLGFENDKPGRVPGGRTVLVAQMSPAWSARHFDDDPEQVIECATAAAARLLGCDLAVAWSDCQRWKFAHPSARVDRDDLDAGASHGLFFAGDSLAGTGRIHRAIETGLDAACRMHGYLGLKSLSPVHHR